MLHSPPNPSRIELSREEIRFLADVAAHPLSTTVSRYQRLHLSRRRGNAIRQFLVDAGTLQAVPIATRSGQVMLYGLTDAGRLLCATAGIDPGPPPRTSLEHQYWVLQAARLFEQRGFEVTREHFIPGDGAVDLLAERPGERIAIEIETGKSDIAANLAKLKTGGFDRLVLLATSPSAVSACHRALEAADLLKEPRIELMTWLDVS